MTNSKRPGITQEIKITPSDVHKALDQMGRKLQPYFREGGRLSLPSLMRNQEKLQENRRI